MRRTITIELVSDIVCPWCYIGKKRLEKAMRSVENDYLFKLDYRPFELHPAVPQEGVDQNTYLVQKFGSEERYVAMVSTITDIAESEGILFKPGRQKWMPNTRKAHALIDSATGTADQPVLVENLFKAYFSDGRDLSRDETLVEIAVQSGLDRQRCREVINDPNNLFQVELQERSLYKLGINSVPFFILNNKFAISGAQQPDAFVKAFHEVIQKSAVKKF